MVDLTPIIDQQAKPFEPAPEALEAPLKRFSATPYSWTDPAVIPKRDWVYDRHLIRKFVSVTIAPGGIGKSSMLITEALAMVSGRPLLGPWPGGALRVWVWNLEDPYDELQRRIQAACQHYELTEADIGDRLFVDSGRDQELCTAMIDRKGGPEILAPVIENLIAEIREKQIDVLIVDPFVSSHKVTENDNVAMDMVAKEWGRVADRTRTAIELVHHTRKLGGDAEATAESGRGAKALVDAARDVRVLNRMSPSEGAKAGVENHRLYFRAYSDKGNLAPPADQSAWHKLENVALANGDEIGVVIPWQWPDPFDDITVEDLKAVQKAFEGRQLRENFQAKDWAGYTVAEALGMDTDDKADRAKVKAYLKTWTENGALNLVYLEDEKGQSRPFLEVGEWAE